MKRLILAVLGLCITSSAFASGTVAYSSFTLTNDIQVLKSATSTNTVVTTLVAVLVSSISTGGILKIFNSSWTTVGVSTVAIVSLGTVGYYPFFDTPLKGIAYTTNTNGGGVTIIYKY